MSERGVPAAASKAAQQTPSLAALAGLYGGEAYKAAAGPLWYADPTPGITLLAATNDAQSFTSNALGIG